jgi:hypothetical protein
MEENKVDFVTNSEQDGVAGHAGFHFEPERP